MTASDALTAVLSYSSPRRDCMHVQFLEFGRGHDLLLGTSERPAPGAVARIRWYLSSRPSWSLDSNVLVSGAAGAVQQMQGGACPQHSYPGWNHG